MKSLRKQLEERKVYLLKIRNEKMKEIEMAPEGSLRINNKSGRTQYYQRKDPKNFTGVYIGKKEFDLAKKLAQKDYDKKVYHSATQELEAIEKCLVKFPKNEIEEIYDITRKERQKLIRPIIITEEELVDNWVSQSYEALGFEDGVPEIYTAKGERVRSKSEMMIADLLEREGIPYRYECPLRMKGWGIVYPDYAESVIQKIATYEKNGIYLGKNLILTFETRKTPLNRKMVQRLIERNFKFE